MKQKTSILILFALLLVAIAALLFSLRPTYKSFDFSTKIPAHWSVVHFGITTGEQPIGLYNGVSLIGTRIYSVSPGIVSVDEEQSPQANFYLIDIASSSKLTAYLAAAPLAGDQVSHRTIGTKSITVITGSPGKVDKTVYLVDFIDVDGHKATLYIAEDNFTGADARAFQRLLESAQFDGADLR